MKDETAKNKHGNLDIPALVPSSNNPLGFFFLGANMLLFYVILIVSLEFYKTGSIDLDWSFLYKASAVIALICVIILYLRPSFKAWHVLFLTCLINLPLLFLVDFPEPKSPHPAEQILPLSVGLNIYAIVNLKFK